MIETELKVALDAQEQARLLRDPALKDLRLGPRRSRLLVSVYYDTPEHALAGAGIALRLRRVGRRWIQTVKLPRGQASSGLFAHVEDERPAPGGRLVLTGADPDRALAAVVRAAAGATLAPVFETRVRRISERLAAPGGGEVELAIDAGAIAAGDAQAPIREAELELVAGEVGAVFAVARALFRQGPVRFATATKAARGYRLARGEPVEPPAAPRRAGSFRFAGDAPVETVARDVFHDCLAQIAANMALLAEDADSEGPHQLRVGLRRLRTALALFAPSLGEEAVGPLSEAAQELGRTAGQLRDLDVLIDEVVADAAATGLEERARAALVAALEPRRTAVRADVRSALAAPEAVGFLFDLAAFIDGRGWLAPSDYSQTQRLAAPIAAVAPAILDKRRKRVRKRGRHIRSLDRAGLHELRKALKKLRYAVDMLGGIYDQDAVAPYLAALKELQDSFGALNDAGMAGEVLAGPAAPGRDDPAVQHGAGWVLGVLAVRSEDDRQQVIRRWKAFTKVKSFWA